MAALVSCPKHNMFWNTATSKTVNDVSYIKAKVSDKTVSISEASIRRDLLFNDVDGIDCLTNQEIYETLQLIGNLDAKKQFLMYLRFVQVFLNNQLSNLPAPLDNLPIPVLTKKVFTNMANTRDQPPVTESSYRPDTTQVPRDSLEGTHGSKGNQVGIFGWILVTGTFVLCGVFLVLHNVTAETCVSMNQWVENPTSHTALDDILPCVDNATTLETSMKSREVTSQLVNVINQVYEETKGRAKDAVISLINQEREGEQIDRALLNNVLGIYVKLGWDKWSTMKETLKLLCLLILLITMLEKHQIGLRKILVLITCSRYSWLKAFTVIAAAFAEDYLKKEIDRVDHYLHSRSRTKLIEVSLSDIYLMLPVVISYVNAAIDTTAIGFKRIITEYLVNISNRRAFWSLNEDIMKITILKTNTPYPSRKIRRTVTVSETEPTTPSVPTKVKDTKQESKINELTKLVQMLIDENVNSTQKTQESNSQIQQTESSKILYCMICKREDHKTSYHEMYIASLKRSENYKAQPYQYTSPSKQILKAKAKPFPPCTHCGFNDHIPDDCRNYPECEICRSYDHITSGHNRVIYIRGGVLSESSQSSESLIGVNCNTCGSTIHSTTDHNEFDHFKRGEKIQATKAREPTKNGCSRSMTGVKSYLHKYVEQPGPKVVFGDNSSCITEGYGSINCRGIIFTKVTFVNGLNYNLICISQLCDAKYIVQFDDKQGIIFNANKEIVLIAPRRNDVYVLDMSSLTPNGVCFFAKASESINWLWHKRLSHINFKNINKLAKQNKVLGLHSLVYSKDKPCSTCEKGKHHRALFKTKQNFSIRKCLHLLHMDLFGPLSPISINHEKYTLVIIDEYSRNEFRNHELESFCDEKGISQNFSSPYTPEQNYVAERKNRTLIEPARTMMNGSVLSKHF
ncbi:retrovirus-related pol polyprotein from transposon TNT 1-94 [Tanacetum coccineum]